MAGFVSGRRLGPLHTSVAALFLLLATSVGAGVAAVGPAWVLGVVVALILAFVTYAAPGCLLALYFLTPLYKATLQPFSPIDLTIVLATLNTIQVFALLKKRPTVRPVPLVLWVVLAGMMLVGTSYAIDGTLALSTAASWIALVFVPLLAAIPRVASDPKAVRQFVLTIGCFGVTYILGGAIGLFGPRPNGQLTVFDANTINVARAALLVPVLGAAYLTTSGRDLKRWLVLALTPAAFAVGIASGSRGPVLFAVPILGAAAVSIARRNRRGVLRRLLGIVTLSALSVAAVAILIPTVPSVSLLRFDGLFAFVVGSADAPGSGTAGRLTLFDVAWRMFTAQPVYGWGLAGFASFMTSHPSLDPNTYPHNALLQFAADFGLIGLGVVSSLLLVALSRPLPDDPAWHAIRYALFFLALNALVSGNIYEDRMLWGLVLLLAFRPDMQVSGHGGNFRPSFAAIEAGFAKRACSPSQPPDPGPVVMTRVVTSRRSIRRATVGSSAAQALDAGTLPRVRNT